MQFKKFIDNKVPDPEMNNLLSLMDVVVDIQFTIPVQLPDRKQKTLELLTYVILQISKNFPTLVILNDVQWADVFRLLIRNNFLLLCSWDLIVHLWKEAAQHLVIVIATRPISPPIVQYEEVQKLATSKLKLAYLEQPESKEIMKSIFGVDTIPDELVELLFKKSQGNPFYVKELCHMLMENGYVKVEDKTCLLKLDSSVISKNIPDTLQKTIVSRLDRLEVPLRELLKVASVIGHEFEVDVVTVSKIFSF